MKDGIPLDQFWEKDDGVRMDDLIRIERFIISQGTNSAQIWGAWYSIKQQVKAALKTGGAPAEQPGNVRVMPKCACRGHMRTVWVPTCNCCGGIVTKPINPRTSA